MTMNKCDVCGNTTFRQQQVEEVFHIEEHIVMVESIPARVCNRCGDTTFDRQTTERIRRMVHDQKPPTRRVNVDVFAYA